MFIRHQVLTLRLFTALNEDVTRSATVTVHIVAEAIAYVSPTGGENAPYATPADAARDIQSAIDAVPVGGEVRVLPGTYDTGSQGRLGPTRVDVNKPIRVVATDPDPANTIIQGGGILERNHSG